MSRELDMQREYRDGVEVIHLRGDVDLQVSARLRRVLLDSLRQGADLLVDMAQVSYIDSSGIASLVEAFQRARKDGRRFALARVPEPAMRVLRIARLDRVFPILDEVDPGFGRA